MKKILLICLVAFAGGLACNDLYAQYIPLNIESEDNYRARKSFQDNAPSADVVKTYISADFQDSKSNLAYAFWNDGIVKDYLHNISGTYYVGEAVGYQISKVYIRWNHGGTQNATLNYGERSDGRPVLRVYTNSGTFVYKPM